MTQERDPALVERMERLVRDMAGDGPHIMDGPWQKRARAIVAELPAPMDADLMELERLIGKCAIGSPISLRKTVLEAYKLGRELARQEGGR